MFLINNIAAIVRKTHLKRIKRFMDNPLDVQEEVFHGLISHGCNTRWGKEHHYADIRSWKQFHEQVPVNTYEELRPYVELLLAGERNVLWDGATPYLAKSSGTTSAKSKFIPVTKDALKYCHYRGGVDMLTLYGEQYPDSDIYTGSNLALGGSKDLQNSSSRIFCGDLSAILIDNLPFWAEYFRTPSKDIALLGEWEQKLDAIVNECIHKNVVSLSGVPSWMILVLQKVLEKTGKSCIKETWHHLEVYFHGGVAFAPYREQYKKLIGDTMNYMETYNASEGFFGLQDRKDSDSLLLLLDHGIFYEFQPLGSDSEKIIPLWEVEVGKNYALIISTNGGLWRYLIGDTVMFTDLRPYRFKITGRTKNFINACGEEIIVDNANKALEAACAKTGAVIKEYTAAPCFNDEQDSKYHEWLIEFATAPNDMHRFVEILDKTLQEVNSDYEAKRYKDLILQFPKVEQVPEGTFYQWLKSNHRLGGQYKVPRLCNDRTHVEQIKSIMHKHQ